jgi:hypothetical protein
VPRAHRGRRRGAAPLGGGAHRARDRLPRAWRKQLDWVAKYRLMRATATATAWLDERPPGRHGPAVPRPAGRQEALRPGGLDRASRRREVSTAGSWSPRPRHAGAYFRGKVPAALGRPDRGGRTGIRWSSTDGPPATRCAAVPMMTRPVNRGARGRLMGPSAPVTAEILERLGQWNEEQAAWLSESCKRRSPPPLVRKRSSRSARHLRARREDQGRARRPVGRDRRGAREQRRGLS